MNTKYEFTGEEKEVLGKTLKRIRATRDFGNVKKGDIGGWIEKEGNLSHEDNAWVSGNAWVYGNTWVSDNAWVYGNARVSDDARVSGNTWVYGNAQVYGNARVSGNTWVSGNAEITSYRSIITFGNVGSRNDTLTAFKTKTGFNIRIGCFLGTLEEFLKKVEETHRDNKFGKEYKLIAEVIKARFEEE